LISPAISWASITPLPFANDGSDMLSPSIAATYVHTRNNMPANPSASTIAGWVGQSSLVELYKQDFGQAEANLPFKDSYSLTYYPAVPASDGPSAGVLKYDGAPDPIMASTKLYLFIKDGNQAPSDYLYDISNWNRMADINFSGYWQGVNGAISHITIYGINKTSTTPPPDDVVVDATPEAASVLIWCGLAGAVAFSARKRLRGGCA